MSLWSSGCQFVVLCWSCHWYHHSSRLSFTLPAHSNPVFDLSLSPVIFPLNCLSVSALLSFPIPTTLIWACDYCRLLRRISTFLTLLVHSCQSNVPKVLFYFFRSLFNNLVIPLLPSNKMHPNFTPYSLQTIIPIHQGHPLNTTLQSSMFIPALLLSLCFSPSPISSVSPFLMENLLCPHGPIKIPFLTMPL